MAVLALFGLMAAPFFPHTVDDAYITFRYSRQWGLGHGPYLNPGEHVEGYSNFLLMLLVTPVIRVAGPGAAVPFAKALGCVAGAFALAGSFLIGRSLARASKSSESLATVAGLVAAGCVACAPAFDVNAVTGLETALYSALVTLGALGLASRSARGLRFGAVALAAAALTRPEGPMILALGWTLAAVDSATSPGLPSEGVASVAPGRTRRDFLIAGLIGTGVVGAHLVFRRICYDGEWVPNTFFAKVGGAGDRLEYVRHGLSHPFLGIAGLLAALIGWLIEPRTMRVALVAGGIGLAGGLLPLASGADWMLGYRLIAPFLPAIGAVVVVGWLRLAQRVFRAPALVALALLATIPGAFLMQSEERRFIENASSVETTGARTGHAALAAWLERDARPGDAIALMDIGQIGFECIEQRVIDVTGLTDRFIAKSPGPFMDKRFDPAYVFDRKPRYVVLVLKAPGGPYDPLPPGATLSHFSKIEERLAAFPEFRSHYRNVRPRPPGAPTQFERLAAAEGAEAIFPYAVPEEHYLLAVYRRHA